MTVYQKGMNDVMKIKEKLNLKNWCGLITRATDVYVDNQDEMDWNFAQNLVDPLAIFYQLNKIPSQKERKELNLSLVKLEQIADILETHPKPLKIRIEKGSKLFKIEQFGKLSEGNFYLKFFYREDNSREGYSLFQKLNQEDFLRALGFRVTKDTVRAFISFRDEKIIKALIQQKNYKNEEDFVYKAIKEKLSKEINSMNKDLFKKLDEDIKKVEKINNKYGLEY